MLNLVELIHWRDDVTAAGREQCQLALQSVSAAALLQPTLPGVYNGGDLLHRRAVATAQLDRDGSAALLGAAAAHVDAAVHAELECGGEWRGAGIYRALLLSVRAGTAPDQVARFERELLAMPRYIGAIRAWRLGRVVEARGARPWTHVWEQRYDRLEGLTGPYMLHPCHWAHVDRWFDPESPDWIVDTRLCHSFCRLPSAAAFG